MISQILIIIMFIIAESRKMKTLKDFFLTQCCVVMIICYVTVGRFVTDAGIIIQWMLTVTN